MSPIPNSIARIFSGFHQDVFLFKSTIEQVIAEQVRMLSAEDVAQAKSFLTDLLDRNDAAEIRSVWYALPKEIRVEGDNMVPDFMRAVRDML
ncbi:MAG: hypothetical protein JSS20_13785 [Proteobacteria bacterium]|nr:hypothetical protein [Pseudomonadota bacterium]